MPSGAGHDAMKLHEVMPQAMLFVRGLNAGISHNPLETITNDDAELAVRGFQHLLEQLARSCMNRALDAQALRRQLDAWIDAHFDDEVRFLQELVRVPTDTPPGDNAPHAERTAALLRGVRLRRREAPGARGDGARRRPAVDHQPDRAAALRRRRAHRSRSTRTATSCRRATAGRTTRTAARSSTASCTAARPRSARATSRPTPSPCARSKSLRRCRSRGGVELHFTYDEEFGGELGPGWLLAQGLTQPDLLIAAGFSYQVVTAHNGCLQLEVTVHGRAAHAAYPDTGVDALQAAERAS